MPAFHAAAGISMVVSIMVGSVEREAAATDEAGQIQPDQKYR
jgi:hypothetical protein